ncbi:hypothetical protein E2C01_086184 [Portunus trituberculatus]|uniref:Uncharacterized protein n=1 Tax=Portunus trituberculatus TaxID=210409 RepID=A0A5B7J8Z9_PORTR|nr:hypothetical protein [Portunus trituberculatus]
MRRRRRRSAGRSYPQRKGLTPTASLLARSSWSVWTVS